MNRLNQILVGLLVVQLIVTAVVLWPHPTTGGEEVSLFPGLEAARIAKLTISDATGKAIQLAKRDGAWVLPEAGDYPTLEDKVPPLLDKIVGLKADRLVTETSGSHKRLKVAEDDFERLVEFVLDDGIVHRLYVGTSPSYSATHVRADSQDEVYLTSDLSANDVMVEATAWVERVYLDVPQDQIVAMILENRNGQLELEKVGESWQMASLAAGETLDEASVTSLVGRARYVVLSQPLGTEKKAAYGLEQPNAVVTLQTHSEAGDKTYTLWVGAQDPADKSYVVLSSESPYYVRVSEYSVKDLVEKTRENLLSPTPTPETTPGATPGTP